MKNLSVILTALTAGTAPLLPQTAPIPEQVVKPAIQVQESGQETIMQIRQMYEEGGYDDFLKELDDSYIVVKENGQLGVLAETRVGFFLEHLENDQKWEERARALNKEKNQELIALMEGQEKTPFVNQVVASTVDLTSDAHQDAIYQITHFRGLTPGSGKNSDENRLIDIDLEYEYKSLHIDLPGAPIENKREKHCALRMEKLDKMLAAASQFEDEKLKESVALYAENFDARLAQNWDATDLNALANGKRKPANALEEKVASLLLIYQEKFSDLTKQFLSEYEKP